MGRSEEGGQQSKKPGCRVSCCLEQKLFHILLESGLRFSHILACMISKCCLVCGDH